MKKTKDEHNNITETKRTQEDAIREAANKTKQKQTNNKNKQQTTAITQNTIK